MGGFRIDFIQLLASESGCCQKIGLIVALEENQEMRVNNQQFVIAIVQHDRLKSVPKLNVLNTL
jgi:hypothetical protein